MKVEILPNYISDSDQHYYEQLNEGWTVPGRDCLQIVWADNEKSTYVIFYGPFTKNEICRDCNSYYELSTGGKNYIIEKNSLTVMQCSNF